MVEISAGWPLQWGPKRGWDTVWPTRNEAEACAERARAQDGWEARVVEIDDGYRAVTWRSYSVPNEYPGYYRAALRVGDTEIRSYRAFGARHEAELDVFGRAVDRGLLTSEQAWWIRTHGQTAGTAGSTQPAGVRLAAGRSDPQGWEVL